MNDNRSSKWRLLLPVAYSAGLFLLSSIPGTIQPDDDTMTRVFLWLPPAWQNLLHIPAYGGLAFSWWWGLERFRLSNQQKLVIACLLAGAWGVLDEIHQSGVPGRYGSPIDLGMNLLGVGLVAWYLSRGFREGLPNSN